MYGIHEKKVKNSPSLYLKFSIFILLPIPWTKIHLTNAHLLYDYFVHLSDGNRFATHGRNL